MKFLIVLISLVLNQIFFFFQKLIPLSWKYRWKRRLGWVRLVWLDFKNFLHGSMFWKWLFFGVVEFDLRPPFFKLQRIQAYIRMMYWHQIKGLRDLMKIWTHNEANYLKNLQNSAICELLNQNVNFAKKIVSPATPQNIS